MVAFSPEREDPGNMVTPRRDIPKVVGGVDARATAGGVRAVWERCSTATVPMSSPAAAEMTKLLENIYRCVNIALVNEMKQLCLRMGIDIWEVIDAAATKPFGFQAFYPGPGRGRALHSGRSVLPDLEGEAVRLRDAVHRAGGRGERVDAGVRGGDGGAGAGTSGARR